MNLPIQIIFGKMSINLEIYKRNYEKVVKFTSSVGPSDLNY